MTGSPQSGPESALILAQAGPAANGTASFVKLLFQYLYGLDAEVTASPSTAARIVADRGSAVRVVCVLQDRAVERRTVLESLGRQGSRPVLLLMPPGLADHHQALAQGMPNLRVCDWSRDTAEGQDRLHASVAETLQAAGVERLPLGDTDDAGEDLPRLQQRLRHLSVLPTLPELVVRLHRMLGDPQTTAADVERVIVSDPAIVSRVLQVVGSPAFSGTAGAELWTLRDAIVRLGFRRVGAIAQQVQLVNGLLRPVESGFDLQRFWRHCLGTALIATRLVRRSLVSAPADIPVDCYWVAGLLHDIGKLVLGFFSWDHFQQVVAQMQAHGDSFHRAELRLGCQVTHEWVGRLMLMNADAPPELVEVVTYHTDPQGREPAPLVAIVHLAHCLCLEAGLGYLPEEPAVCRATVLMALGLKRRDLPRLCKSLGDVSDDVEQMASYCLD